MFLRMLSEMSPMLSHEHFVGNERNGSDDQSYYYETVKHFDLDLMNMMQNAVVVNSTSAVSETKR